MSVMAQPRVTLVAAVARGGAMGREGGLPWHLPEDLKHLRALTLGHPVIMGRKTWDSLPDRFRPLPGRTNIVVSRNPNFEAPGAVPAGTLEAAIQAAQVAVGSEAVFVIGGAQIYAAALPLADALVLTEIDADFPADTFFPAISPATWHEAGRTRHLSASGLSYAIVRYERSHAE